MDALCFEDSKVFSIIIGLHCFRGKVGDEERSGPIRNLLIFFWGKKCLKYDLKLTLSIICDLDFYRVICYHKM